MEMRVSEIDGVKKVSLLGRLDAMGADVIETQFSGTIAPGGVSTIVDLSELTFLASLGVRMFISTARALSWRGAKLVMYGARPAVAEIIETMGFGDIVPLVGGEAEALALVAG
jgi:anti-sigma B factor antagonist